MVVLALLNDGREVIFFTSAGNELNMSTALFLNIHFRDSKSLSY